MPYFSIVIPVYNRPALVARAIASASAQSFGDFEIIVVDDGSTDGTAESVRSVAQPNLTILAHPRNLGPCPARRTGIGAARGDWVIFLDSDDELFPDALEIMHRRAGQVSGEIGRMVFMYRLVEGGYSPEPSLVEEIWDYTAYLRWAEGVTGRADYCHCIRRETFRKVGLPEDRAGEQRYQFEFARHFKTHAFADVVARVHDDAFSRASLPSRAEALLAAPDDARSLERLLREHGAAMALHCPKRFYWTLRRSALQFFLAGQPLRGGIQTFHLLRLHAWSVEPWTLLALGLLGKNVTAAVFGARSRLKRRYLLSPATL